MTFATSEWPGRVRRSASAMRIGVSRLAGAGRMIYMMDLMEKGGNVVATGSGNIDPDGFDT